MLVRLDLLEQLAPPVLQVRRVPLVRQGLRDQQVLRGRLEPRDLRVRLELTQQYKGLLALRDPLVLRDRQAQLGQTLMFLVLLAQQAQLEPRVRLERQGLLELIQRSPDQRGQRELLERQGQRVRLDLRALQARQVLLELNILGTELGLLPLFTLSIIVYRKVETDMSVL